MERLFTYLKKGGEFLIFGLIIGALIAGCGGGSSTPSPSALGGTAAVGSPIVNAPISVICAAGSTLTVPNTNSSGAWSVTLSGQTLPCVVQLSGGTINSVANTTPYTSIAIAPGTVNITPLTDLLVANLVGATPSTWFGTLTPAQLTTLSITQSKVNTAASNLASALPALTSLSANNPITTDFTPQNGNVVDNMLTALKTAIANNTAGVTYTSLLGNLSATTVPAAGFGTALTSAYTGNTTAYTIGGTVSGLTGSVVLQDNGGDNHTVTANGSFTFATPVANVGPYSVSVLTQPSGQTCSVSTGAGTVSGSNVTNVAVACSTNSYTVGGSVSGLSGSAVLKDNNGDNLTVSANGSFTFATAVASGSPYSVSVFSHPASQSCSIASASGTISAANITNVFVTCATNTYTIGGTVTGLSGSVVLQDNGGNDNTLSTNGSFTFTNAIAYGNAYNATVLTQPSGQTCTVTAGSGTTTATVTSVAVSCTNSAFTIAPPTAPTGAPADAGTAGTLPFLTLTFNTTNASSNQNVTITGTGTTSVMTFSNPAYTLTGATGNTPIWSANTGKVYAAGNVVSYCSAGNQITSSSADSVNMPFMNGHVINISANLVAVSDFTEMKNVSLTKFDCAGSLGTLTFNSTGDSLTNTDRNGTATLSSSDVAQLTSINGTTYSDGSNNKVRGYKYVTNGVTKYFLVTYAQYSGTNSGGHVALYY